MEAVLGFQKLTEAIERLVQEEKVAVETLQAKATGSPDPTLGEIYSRLSDIKLEFVAELESRLSELKSQAEITAQINAMYL